MFQKCFKNFVAPWPVYLKACRGGTDKLNGLASPLVRERGTKLQRTDNIEDLWGQGLR
jgi:hypothetical protein